MNDIKKQLEKLTLDIRILKKKIYDTTDDQLINASFIEDRLNLKAMEEKYIELSSYAATMPGMTRYFKCWAIDLDGAVFFENPNDIIKAKRASIANNDNSIFEERVIQSGGSILESLVKLLKEFNVTYNILVNEFNWFIQIICDTIEADMITEVIWEKFERSITNNFINISKSFIGFEIDIDEDDKSKFEDYANYTDISESEISDFLKEKFDDIIGEDVEEYYDDNDQEDIGKYFDDNDQDDDQNI